MRASGTFYNAFAGLSPSNTSRVVCAARMFHKAKEPKNSASHQKLSVTILTFGISSRIHYTEKKSAHRHRREVGVVFQARNTVAIMIGGQILALMGKGLELAESLERNRTCWLF